MGKNSTFVFGYSCFKKKLINYKIGRMHGNFTMNTYYNLFWILFDLEGLLEPSQYICARSLKPSMHMNYDTAIYALERKSCHALMIFTPHTIYDLTLNL